jgi:hypothetical protein
VVVGGLSIIGLVLAAAAAVVAVNWDAVFRHFGDALTAQTERTNATLFRLGEVMSISAELKSEYGTEPDVIYSTSSDGRILSISLSDYQLPEQVTAKDHAREIAAFAVGKSKKIRIHRRGRGAIPDPCRQPGILQFRAGRVEADSAGQSSMTTAASPAICANATTR